MALVCPSKITIFKITFFGLKLALKVHSRVRRLGLKIILDVEENLREVNWFHKSWILAAVSSHGFSLPIETNCLSRYFVRVIVGFGSTP